MLVVPWSAVIGCFTPHATDPHEFHRSVFHPEHLQYRLDDRLGAGAVAVPADLYTTGYADETERFRYGREVAARLATLGVEVTGVPPPDPVREKWHGGGERPPSGTFR